MQSKQSVGQVPIQSRCGGGPAVTSPAQFMPPSTLKGFASSATYWRKFRNSHLQLHWLWPLVIQNSDFDLVLDGKNPPLISRLPAKLLWFWPRITDARVWVQGKQGAGHSPLHYVDVDPSTEWIMGLYASMISEVDAKVCDLGCNSGRHLDCLYRLGFRRLYGLDAMGSALQNFQQTFPITWADASVEHDLFQRYLARQSDCAFDATYAFGCTIELAHPSFPIVREICRVTRRLFMGVMHEHAGPYPRFWIDEFRRNSFDLVFAMRPFGTVDGGQTCNRDTSLLIFRRAE
jgi:SAM-dependent methyltransferase